MACAVVLVKQNGNGSARHSHFAVLFSRSRTRGILSIAHSRLLLAHYANGGSTWRRVIFILLRKFLYGYGTVSQKGIGDAVGSLARGIFRKGTARPGFSRGRGPGE